MPIYFPSVITPLGIYSKEIIHTQKMFMAVSYVEMKSLKRSTMVITNTYYKDNAACRAIAIIKY